MRYCYTVVCGVVAFSVSACASQPPSPVIEGFKRAYDKGIEPVRVVAPVRPLDSYVQFIAETYYVQEGDTLEKISAHYNVSPESLLQKNNLVQGGLLEEGSALKIPTETAAQQPSTYRLTRQSTEVKTQAYIPGNTVIEKDTAEEQKEASTKLQNALNAADSILDTQKAPQKMVAKPTFHTIQAGENIYRIAMAYGVSQFDIMAANDISDPSSLSIGTKLLIPTAGEEIIAPKITSAPQIAIPEKRQIIYKKAHAKTGLVWPVEGKVTKKFGNGGEGVTNSGIVIHTKEAAPIVSVAAGTIIYAGNMEFHGNLVLIRHKNSLVTAYAHNHMNLVRKGEKVKRGEVVALAGSTGNVGEPQLYFEVRRRSHVVNPLKVLPKQ